jgi:hypothetical protein
MNRPSSSLGRTVTMGIGRCSFLFATIVKTLYLRYWGNSLLFAFVLHGAVRTNELVGLY